MCSPNIPFDSFTYPLYQYPSFLISQAAFDTVEHVCFINTLPHLPLGHHTHIFPLTYWSLLSLHCCSHFFSSLNVGVSHSSVFSLLHFASLSAPTLQVISSSFMALNIISMLMTITLCLSSRYLSKVQMHISISAWMSSRHPKLNISKTKFLTSPSAHSILTFPISLICNSIFPDARSKKVSSSHLISNPSGNSINSKFKINPVSDHFSLLQP